MSKQIKIVCSVLIIALILSISCNIFLALSKNLRVENTYNQQHYINESQATLIMSVFAAQGKLRWNVYRNNDLEEKGFQQENVGEAGAIVAFLNSLKPEQSLLSKVSIDRWGDYYIFVPTIIEDMTRYNDSKVWKKLK